MGRSNSRSHSSRSKSRSRSSSRSRSRSHSRKKRYSSRSRSRTYSRSRSRERMYNRDNRDNRDFRDNRDYHRDYRNNRGMRRPYGFRPMRRGFFPGGGGGRFMHRGGFRPMWNRRHSRSPRRERSRSRTPKRRSVSSQRSRSRSHRSYRSSRSPRSSSSGSSSQYSKSPVRPKKRISREKKAKKLRSAPSHDSPLNTKSHDEPKDAFERDPSESLDEFSKASGVCVDTWAGLSAYDNSPRSPHSPSPVASPSSLSSSDSDTPILSTAKDTTSPLSPVVQHSPESIDNGSARYSPSQNSPLHHIPSKRSPAKTVPLEESRTGELELSKSGKLGKRPLHKMESRDKSFREDSPLKIKMVASDSHRPEVKLKMSTVPLDDVDRSTSLMNDRLLASTLVHSVSKDQEFRSIFDHLKLPQSTKTSSESFIEHIVSLVHHVQEHYFRSSGMSLHERFGGYQKAVEVQAVQQKSPEIHRRIDISPSILKKHTRLAGEEKVFKDQGTKSDKKLKGITTDKRQEVERRRKHRSKDRSNSKGSRESSGSRKKDKLQKEYKEFKLYKEESKRKNKEQERSPSPSSSSSSREEKTKKKERDEEFRSQQEQKDYSGFAGPSRPRGTFFRIRGRGRARGIFAGTNTGPTNVNPPPFPTRPPEEEWDPEYTPKSKKYFLHDDRDDGIDYWGNRGRGRGIFQRGRGRFTFKKSGSSPKWTHDKYQGDGLVEDEDESMENDEERKDGRKEEKD
ncbi:bcl-2-associated transcription factor 1 isoform X5 [Lissotriton helveticus]